MNHEKAVRLAVYRGYVEDGRPPDVETMAVELALSTDAVHESLQQLHESRHIVLRDGEIVMAHPFASVPLGFSVMGTRHALVGRLRLGLVRHPAALPG